MNIFFSLASKTLMVALVSMLATFSYAAQQKGTMTDARDGKKYKTAQIGEQVWMAENLNYEMQGGYCYSTDPNCAKYGRFYEWNAAKKACPDGWHLPSKAEFETLFELAGGSQVAGKALKSKNGWRGNGNGTDAFSFSALPGGYRRAGGWDYNMGSIANFWSSTKDDYSTDAYYMDLSALDSKAKMDRTAKNEELSVRCLQGENKEDVPVESKADETETIYYKTLVDKRDGKKYKILELGNQTWMAENLNYKTEDSYCYENNESNCSKYGRLYKWRVALKACPAGWHLPSKAEFKTLLDAVGGKQAAGKNLKSVSNNGDDTIGFSALLAGTMSSNGIFLNEGFITNFWSSTENNSNRAYALNLSYNGGKADLSFFDKEFGVSIRCLEDSP